jgi:6-pyruvoyl-tetrahydropterin synthase
MFSVTVRDHVMIAHSFKGEVFGPAQKLHGATFIVDVTFERPEIDEDGIVVDIGRAIDRLKEVCSEINYKNLDELDMFAGKNTTTEFLSRWIWGRFVNGLKSGRLGPGSDKVTGVGVELHESHVARAGYKAAVPGRA